MSGVRKCWSAITAALCALAAPQPARTEPPDAQTAAFSTERHFTSNALDSTVALPDWYTLMRGSLGRTWEQENGHFRLGAEFQAAKYDTYEIEDDLALALAAEAQHRLGERFEIRGALSYQVMKDGDELEIGDFIIGTNTRKQVFGGQLQLGADLGNATALVLEIADAFEKSGETKFQDDLFLPAKLDPDTNRLKLSARLTRTSGNSVFGAVAAANVVSVEKIGDPPSALSFTEFTLKGEAKNVAADGTTIGLALGAQMLQAANGIYRGVRPTYQALFIRPLPKGFELRGSVSGAFETVDSDDPLCSWLNRGELEARFRATDRLALAAGVFAEMKENLLFENKENSRGAYVELAYDATENLALVFRADFSTTFATVIETHKRTTDAFVGIRAKL